MAGGHQTYDWRRTIENKTAAYTFTQADSGKLFTNFGASGSVTFTCPTPSAALDGVQVEVYGAADQELVIAAASSGDFLIVHNDVAADSITTGAGDHVGACVRLVCSNTIGKWLVIYQSDSTSAVTWTVA